MKSSITTYVLIAAVVAVWGFVAWKIFFANPGNTPIVAEYTQAPASENETGEELLLDYRDPFLKGAATAKLPPPSGIHVLTPKPAPPIKKPAAPPVILPFKYTGTISTGGRRLYIFEYEGGQQMLASNEELAGYRLAETYTDSVRFARDGDIFTAHLQK